MMSMMIVLKNDIINNTTTTTINTTSKWLVASIAYKQHIIIHIYNVWYDGSYCILRTSVMVSSTTILLYIILFLALTYHALLLPFFNIKIIHRSLCTTYSIPVCVQPRLKEHPSLPSGSRASYQPINSQFFITTVEHYRTTDRRKSSNHVQVITLRW